MKKQFLAVVMLCMSTLCVAQADKQEATYRRSSLYTLMLPDETLGENLKAVIKSAFLEQAFPDKYNDHNLSDRILDKSVIGALSVTQEEIGAVQGSSAKVGKLAGKFGGAVAPGSAAATSSDSSDDELVAKLLKHFAQEHVAGRMVAKWFGGGEAAPTSAKPLDVALIEDRGLNTLSQEELNKAMQVVGGKEKLLAAAEYDLMNRTFVTVTSYSYLSVEQILEIMNAAAGAVLGGKAGSIASLSSQGLAAVLKGYFVKTSTYLFQLDVTNDKINELVSKYASDIRGLYTDDDVKLKYVGKTWDFAPAAMSLSLTGGDLDKLVTRATIRATDGTMAKLQAKYDQFKTLATLHQDGKSLFAYIGVKEGCKEGDKFEILQKTIDKNGNEVYEVVGKAKIEKGQLWDNRAGANENIEGAATGLASDGNPSLTFSSLGKSKDLLEGSLIRQKK